MFLGEALLNNRKNAISFFQASRSWLKNHSAWPGFFSTHARLCVQKSDETLFFVLDILRNLVERFSLDCGKTKPK